MAKPTITLDTNNCQLNNLRLEANLNAYGGNINFINKLLVIFRLDHNKLMDSKMYN